MDKPQVNLLKNILAKLSQTGDPAFISSLERSIVDSAQQTEKNTAFIESAVELTESEQTEIWTRLLKAYPGLIQPIFTVNRDLLGGLKIKIGDNRLDFSLAKSLENIKANLW